MLETEHSGEQLDNAHIKKLKVFTDAPCLHHTPNVHRSYSYPLPLVYNIIYKFR